MRTGGLEELAELVPDGAAVAFSGAVLRGKPVAAARALAEKRDLDLVAFTGSLEVELLLAAGALRSVTSSYVGLGGHGAARAFARAVAEGTVDDRELSEWMLVGGLRAATMGIPFLPTRAALGSQLVEERGFLSVVDPYGGDEFLAVPPLRPDVGIVHAWRADEDGNVQFPWPPDHLADADVLVARASAVTIVTVEEIVPRSVVAGASERTRLFGFEVDLLVEAPGGARPGSLPPLYAEDEAWLGENAAAVGEALLAETGRCSP
jgi:glutaconate CoA-transferase, subunit A